MASQVVDKTNPKVVIESERPSKRKATQVAMEKMNGTAEPPPAPKEVVEPKKKRGAKGKEEKAEEEPVVEEVISSKLYPVDSKVEAKMHNSWY